MIIADWSWQKSSHHQTQKPESAPTPLHERTSTKRVLVIYLPSQGTIITHVDAGKRPQTRDTQAFKQRVNHDKCKPIENLLNTVPLSPENLVDRLLQETSEDMPSNAESSLHTDQISITITPSADTNEGVRDSNFRKSLTYRNIYINDTDASSKLVERANRIITTERPTSEIDNAIAQELAVRARILETGTEQDLIQRLGTDLIPAMRKVPHQNLEASANKLCSSCVEVPLPPDALKIPPQLPKPKPDLVFGYSSKAFKAKQLKAIDLLVDQLGRIYAVPDGKVRFPFLVL